MARILIADDEPNITAMISRYVQREGYEATVVSDGRQAVEACKEADFDLIVMDVMMPDTDGFTACKKIKEFKDIPVIMLSARGTEYDKLFGFEVGVDDYVTKRSRLWSSWRVSRSFSATADPPKKRPTVLGSPRAASR